MKSMTSIENKRFEIREPIRSFLSTVKEYFGYDACALYLISAEETMHKKEKEEEFEKRFSGGEIIIECLDEVKKRKDGGQIEEEKSFIQNVKIKFTGVKEYEKDKKNDEICRGLCREKIDITFISENKDTVTESIEYNKCDTPYKILKFIGVDDSYISSGESKQYWIYDYDKRPNKYIVFDHSFFNQIPEMNGKKVLYIANEGITAMVGRGKNYVHMDKDQIYKIFGPKVRLKKDDTERNIHPECRELLAIPIYEDNEIKGVLRLDIYDDPKNPESAKKRKGKYLEIIKSMDEKKSKKIDKPNDLDNIIVTGKDDLFKIIQELCLQVIKVSGAITEKDAYDDLFQGKKIIDAILSIGGKASAGNRSNKKIYELTKHLFFVFQRHTYAGYEEIMTRTMLYIKDVFKSVGMEKYYDLTERKLYDFMDHEKLMLYSTKKYRDHFMHQFHVFVMGYIIINAIGIGVIKEKINKRLECTEEYHKIKIDDDGVLRIWILISLFHDIAYIFQQYDKTMQKFISDNLLADIPVHIDWGIILSSSKNKVSYINTMSELTKFFTSPEEGVQPNVQPKMQSNSRHKTYTNKTELLKNYIQAIEDNQDHGVLGAILLINLYMKIIKDNYDGCHNVVSSRIVELYLAALAISMHNSCTYKTLKESSEKRYISFDSFPLEFLLMYCDTAQEWGRKKEVDKVFYDAPVLESIKIDLIDQVDSASNEAGKPESQKYGASKIMCKLKYEELNYPDEEKLNSFFLEKLSKFRSDKIKFEIEYGYGKSNDIKTVFKFSCNDDDKDDVINKKEENKENGSENTPNETTPNEAVE
jgi:hypothetical protein